MGHGLSLCGLLLVGVGGGKGRVSLSPISVRTSSPLRTLNGKISRQISYHTKSSPSVLWRIQARLHLNGFV